MIDEFNRWKEAVGLSIAALFGWIFTLGRFKQRLEDRIGDLETWRQEHSARVDSILRHLNAQDAQLAAIRQQVEVLRLSLLEVRKDIRVLIASRLDGGHRWYDPPEDD